MTTAQIHALLRLKREGDPDSKTNQKLREASQTIADYLMSLAPENCEALEQRGYTVQNRALMFGGGPVKIEASAPLPILLRFATDVAQGLVENVEREEKIYGTAKLQI